MMNFDINKLVAECDPCQRHHRSHAKERVEVSHASMCNIWPGHTLHMDFCKFKNVHYVFMVDRLTEYIQDSQPVHTICHLGGKALGQQVRVSIKIISDSDGGLRDDFITQTEDLGTRNYDIKTLK